MAERYNDGSCTCETKFLRRLEALQIIEKLQQLCTGEPMLAIRRNTLRVCVILWKVWWAFSESLYAYNKLGRVPGANIAGKHSVDCTGLHLAASTSSTNRNP